MIANLDIIILTTCVTCNIDLYYVTCNKTKELILQTNISKRVNKHRAALRAAGLRPVQIWVPDTRQSSFAEECRRQSLMLQNDPQEADVLNWLEVASDTEGWK